jgi:hypothetical protein
MVIGRSEAVWTLVPAIASAAAAAVALRILVVMAPLIVRSIVGRRYTDRFAFGEEDGVAHTYHELKEKTIQELRDIAKGVENQDAVQGYSQMNKDHLLPALCKALSIPIHEHHEVVGIDKPAIKARMRELKKERDAALEARDHGTLKSVRRQIHRLNRQIRAHVAL